MNNSSLAIYGQFDTIQRAAIALQSSGYFKDATSQAQAIAKVMAGAELGLPPFASMAGIHIVQGKPVLGSNVIATLIKNDPRYDYAVKVCTDKECVIEWLENGHATGQSAFTFDEANKAGLTGKDNWKKYPSDMLFARAISRGARRFAPGIFGGAPVYTPDEMNIEVDEEGYITDQPAKAEQPEITEAEVTEVEQTEQPETMTLADAEAVQNSEGECYGDIETKTLSHMINSITKAMKKEGIAADKLAEYQHKQDAIKIILASRENK